VFCDAGEPVGQLRFSLRKAEAQVDDGNGEVEDSAGDIPAADSPAAA